MRARAFVVLLFISDGMDKYVEIMEEILMNQRAIQNGTYGFIES